MPAIRIPQPAATARSGFIDLATTCAAADVRKIDPAIRPASAWLPMPTTSARKEGATAAKSPVTAKPANAARAATTNTDAGLGWHRQPLHAEPAGAGRRLGGQQHRQGGERGQHEVHDEAQIERAGGVLHQHTGQHRAETEPTDVDDGRDRGGPGTPAPAVPPR